MESSNRVVIVGKTGCGKTTFLLKLSTSWAKNENGPLDKDLVVFHLHLSRLDHSSNLAEAIVDDLLPRASKLSIEEYIEKNQEKVIFSSRRL